MSTPAPLVLVVEDEPPIAGLVRGFLEREGLRVRVVGDGVSALAASLPSGLP